MLHMDARYENHSALLFNGSIFGIQNIWLVLQNLMDLYRAVRFEMD